MNLDRLIKLAKLANSNPNEHEANAAARKVCRLIAENNYSFNGAKNQEPATSGARTWNDVKRSQDPFWRVWEEAFKGRQNYQKYRNGSWDNYETPNPPPPEPPKQPNPPPGWYHVNWDFTTNTKKEDNKGYKRSYEPKNRDCTVCNLTKGTTDTTTPYICADCKWRRYHAEKGETSE